MEIQDLSNTKGLLSLKLGSAKIIEDYTNIVHIIDLELYLANVEKIQKSVEIINKNKSLMTLTEITNFKYRELERQLNVILPRNRNRRGIINGLGTIIKSITGNMDDSDAILINKQLETLKENQDILGTENAQQIMINKEVTQRFENITKHINDQQEILENFLNKYQMALSNKVRSEQDTIQYMQYIYQTNFNIDTLKSHLQDIAESIQLAKLNIISKQILNPLELTYIFNNLEKNNITTTSFEEVYSLLELQAYYNHSKIIFNIKMPIPSQEIFSLHHLIPLPINKTHTIHLPKPYVLLSNLFMQYLDKPCLMINEVYYCKKTNLKKISNDDCIPNLVKNHQATCELEEQQWQTQIMQPEDHFIVLIDVPNTKLKTTCGIDQKIISGNSLIHYENCDIIINNIQYSSKPHIFWDKIEIIPSSFIEINGTKTLEKLSLHKLEKYNMKNQKTIDILNLRTEHQSSIFLGSTTLIIIVIVIIIVTYLKQHTFIHTEPMTQLQLPSLSLRGEELRTPQHPATTGSNVV